MATVEGHLYTCQGGPFDGQKLVQRNDGRSLTVTANSQTGRYVRGVWEPALLPRVHRIDPEQLSMAQFPTIL